MSFVYRFDTSRWPLVVCPSPGSAVESEIDSDSFYEQAELVLGRRTPFAYMHDIRGTKGMSATRRRRFVEFVKAEDHRVRRYVRSCAVLLDSRLQQGIITAITWMMRSPAPFKVFYRDPDAAAEWALEIHRQGDHPT